MALLPQARVHTAGLCSGCWCPPTPSSRITQPSLPGCPGYWLLMREAEFLPGIAFPSWEPGPQTPPQGGPQPVTGKQAGSPCRHWALFQPQHHSPTSLPHFLTGLVPPYRTSHRERLPGLDWGQNSPSVPARVCLGDGLSGVTEESLMKGLLQGWAWH